MMSEMNDFLAATYFIDADHADVQAFALAHTHEKATPIEKAVALFYAVRDGFSYNPYKIILKPEYMKASYQASKSDGYCIEKSNLFAAAARAVGIPSRLGFGNVRNHLGTKRLEAILGTDLLVFHGYAEVFLGGRWVKATPVFDAPLCAKLGVAPLDFDGLNDCVFQASDKSGQPFMEYIEEHGVFADLPFALFVENLRKHYPHLFLKPMISKEMTFDFE
jgi:transglutaminase-like putative cysteine protease